MIEGLDLSALTPDEKRELYELLKLKDIRAKRNRLAAYKPYAKQVEFHNRGAEYRERLFLAGNQLGKTWAGAYEVAMHLTGRYPDWWQGRRYNYATRWMAGSESAELTKKGVQRLLLGPPELREEWGTGAIPKECLRDTSLKAGVPDAVSSIIVRHACGEDSVIQFNSYDQGRMQHVDSPVLTPTGWKAIGTLNVGDEVIAGDGSVTLVEGVFPHGVKDLYELEFDSGVKTLAGAEHLWLAACRTNGPWKTVTTADLIAVYGDAGGRVTGNKQFSTPNVGVVQLASQPVPVDPYLVGALLGDGCVRGGRIRFTSSDPEIVNEVAKGASLLGAELVQWSEIQYGFKNSELLRREMDALGMNGLLAHEKKVPQQYLWNDPAVRMAVLQGLMDTDGSVSAKGSMTFGTTSLPLAQDVAFLVRSLGGKAIIRTKGDKGRKRTLYVVSVRLPGSPPFRLARKLERCVRPTCETHRHILRSIRKVDPGQAVCIAVAHPSHLYVTDDFIVTHNTKWQADTVDGVWFDEEPPQPVYSEGLTRTNATGGMVFVTFTPLLGMSDVVKRFLLDKPAGACTTTMTINDVEHYTQEEREAIIASYPEHEREARAKGIPIMGSGRVFPIVEDGIKCNPFAIPPHWPRIVGLDFGIDHPTAAVWMAWDRDADVLYVTDTYRVKDQSILIHGASIKARGDWVPVAWPHDGLQRDKGSGEQLMVQYKNQGLNMLKERATFEDGTNGVEAGLADMLTRMQTQRFKVFGHLSDWFEEFRLYHRKDGMVVKQADDLMSATRYALMMRRFAKTQEEAQSFGLRKNGFSAPVLQFFDHTV